jgi:hypothetical protein
MILGSVEAPVRMNSEIFVCEFWRVCGGEGGVVQEAMYVHVCEK